VVTKRDLVEKSRKFWIDFPNSKDFLTSIYRSSFPPKHISKWFGETLTELDGLTDAYGETVNDADCTLCGKSVGADEPIVEVGFNVNCEYDCEMFVCKECIDKMKAMLMVTK